MTGRRLPVLKDSTKRLLIEKAGQYEMALYGRLPKPHGKKPEQQRGLFD